MDNLPLIFIGQDLPRCGVEVLDSVVVVVVDPAVVVNKESVVVTSADSIHLLFNYVLHKETPSQFLQLDNFPL